MPFSTDKRMFLRGFSDGRVDYHGVFTTMIHALNHVE